MQHMVSSLFTAAVESCKQLSSALGSPDDLIVLLDQDLRPEEAYRPARTDADRGNPASYVTAHFAKMENGAQIRQALEARAREVVRTGDPAAMLYHTTIEQHRRTYSSRITPRTDTDGDVCGVVVCCRDITAAEEIETQLDRLKADVSEALRTQIEFIAQASHELRTPLNGILGIAEVLKDTNLDTDQKHLVDVLGASGEVLRDIIDDVLDFSRHTRTSTELEHIPFDLHDVLGDVIQLMAMPAEAKGLELALRFPPDAPRNFFGDAGRIRQVVLNLVSNAIKFTDDGHVLVEVAAEPIEDERMQVTITVEDTGIGIAPDEHDVLFEAFSQATTAISRREQGSGLGLAICKQLTELMGGQIAVDSQPDEGTRFRVTVELARLSNVILPVLAADLHGRRALLVDPNHIQRWISQEYLQDADMRVTCADAAGDALDLMREAVAQHDPFDVVLIARQLTRGDGPTLGRLIKSDPTLSHTPLLLLCPVHLDESPHPSFPSKDFEARLLRPIRPGILLDSVAAAIEGGFAELTSEPVDVDPDAFAAEIEKSVEAHAETEVDSTPSHVLVVEDDPVSQMVTVRMLERAGHNADLAESGEQALELIDPDRHRVVLLDCQMPGLSGFETARRIRARGIDTPIVALTAAAVEGIEQHCREAGMDAYLPKPVRYQCLCSVVERWSGENSSTEEFDPGDLPAALDLEGLVDRFEDDVEFIDEVTDMFRSDVHRLMGNLVDALSERDARRLARNAHTLAGAAAQAGAMAISELASRTEQAADMLDWEDCERLCWAIGAHHRLYEARVAEYRAQRV
ncbi:response regulator [Persicimonas caeni]|uniref:histidine kinase n=1 Tax=Persicimonas caeni TaxID=2292766 RepID=A0A4Y6PSR8_PERCE|nr:ATP-binding protein [Persicimonas caeni]QDG51376.1 response regulator [Persicimonas caeni]QED32597.1 response regulator [Persicimonas caeni]